MPDFFLKGIYKFYGQGFENSILKILLGLCRVLSFGYFMANQNLKIS